MSTPTAAHAALSATVYAIVAELTNAAPGELRGSDRLREDLGLDSLHSMELLSRVSETFDIDPDLETVMQVATIDEVIAALSAHLSPAPSPSEVA